MEPPLKLQALVAGKRICVTSGEGGTSTVPELRAFLRRYPTREMLRAIGQAAAQVERNPPNIIGLLEGDVPVPLAGLPYLALLSIEESNDVAEPMWGYAGFVCNRHGQLVSAQMTPGGGVDGAALGQAIRMFHNLRELNDMMTLMRVYSRARLGFLLTPDLQVNFNAGAPYALSKKTEPEPLWVLHGKPGGKNEYFEAARCVELFDVPRTNSGRPVNFNGFIPNTLPSALDADDFIGGGANTALVVQGFPVLAVGSGYEAGGVDPQMPYCHLPPLDEIAAALSAGFAAFHSANWAQLDGTTLKSSGYVGTSLAGAAAVRKFGAPWQDAVNEVWTPPEVGEWFCDDTTANAKGAVWRALCFAPGSDPVSLGDDVKFQRFGQIPTPGAVLHADEKKVGSWLSPVTPGKKTKYGQMLFDLRKGNVASGSVPFQYPLTQRNIFDALELACHAETRAATAVSVNCDTLDPKNLPTGSLDAFASVLECLAQRLGRTAERFAVGPVPKSLLDSFSKKNALPSTTGLGGEYLQTLGRQYQSLTRVAADYAKLRDATNQLALAMRKMKQITKEKDALTEATAAAQLATMFQAYATAATAAGQVSATNPASGAAAAAASAATFAAAGAQMVQLAAQGKANNAQTEQKRLDVVSTMVSNVQGAREAADDFVLALNDLNQATADQKLVQKKAAKAAAGMNFADYSNDPSGKKDPQFVNVVMRRMFNTKLLRYENAFQRAKRLAYLARRAVELRFGVDLQRLDQPMTLVDPPSKWANDICNLQGIDYAEIRQPNPEEPVSGTSPGDKPLPGDDFAHAYVGDYVQRLEDFVNSYPIDFPLKDGDDTAVLSLADDVYNVSVACTKPGRNFLYFSAELDKSDNFETPSAATQGWFVRGCGLTLPGSGGAVGPDWTGCVGVAPSLLTSLSTPGLGLTREGLPTDALAYRLRNEPCIPETATENQTTVCPNALQYSAVGSVSQNLIGLEPGTHIASVHALAAGVFPPGDGPVIRVVRASDGVAVTTENLTLTPGLWQRTAATFVAASGEDYRIEILPSKLEIQLNAATPSAWPSVYVAAAQVERAVLATGATTSSPATWVRTDLSRDVQDPICHELRGPALRSRFRRRCEYVCADGIQTGCGAIDSNSVPSVCFYEADFPIRLEEIENGTLIPSGQIAIGNFNYRHNLVGLNAVGTGIASCDGKSASCYYNGFLEYSLIHSGNTVIRNYTGGSLPAKLDRGVVEHGKLLAAERTITNPPSSADSALMEPYMKHEFKGRPVQGLYTLRIWEKPGLRWEQLDDIQLVWKYHYWTRFPKEKP